MGNRRKILEDLAAGRIGIEEADRELRAWTMGEIGDIAVIDGERADRSGIPEIVYGEGKSPTVIVQVTRKMIEEAGFALITRIDNKKLAALRTEFKDHHLKVWEAEDHNTAVVSSMDWSPDVVDEKIAIITAGTSDIPFANEVEAVAYVSGVDSIVFRDVGVAGIHRVPVGYGFRGRGETALAAMLQSCSPGLAVVNIGNGVGAGAFACLIAKKCASRRR
ncbi:MAG: hypothetical protein ACTSPE_13435 [Candidatus Thorarchaeota archaeon]